MMLPHWGRETQGLGRRNNHLLKKRFGKIITFHGVGSNICKCFPYVIIHLLLNAMHTLRKNCPLQSARYRGSFLRLGWKWHKFAALYITAIQSMVAGNNVAIHRDRSVFLLYIWRASFDSCCLHMCDKHSTKQSTKTLFVCAFFHIIIYHWTS